MMLLLLALPLPVLASVDQVSAITLRDVHPLYGGQILYLSADGSGYCQLVTHPSGTAELHEQRYRLALPPARVRTLWQLLSADQLRAASSSTQPGLPGAARPRIVAQLASGQRIDLSRWQHDRQPEFDAIYQALLAITRDAATGSTLLAEGRFDPQWQPQQSATH
ncbi:hypothetical protein GJ699_20060 [Duganella sp. FT80W]|uniref:Uncharacterized protein n=1 Tax=Duganella guangzhouensis TaxID=2666084 RepID=A0A6I2L5Y6_9BURK|nr:hypothetical protein [Duganella guangzhouensis]MRW92294.1 hypothetical protein [Duganella guangzhouensis]